MERHKLSELDTDSRTALCSVCGPVRIRLRSRMLLGSSRWRCCIADNNIPRKPKDPAIKRQRDRRRYGINVSEEEYQQLLEKQEGCCAICHKPPGKIRLAVDHDHVTGKVRGLLCKDCNLGLGLFFDDPKRLLRAIQYLTRFI